MYAFERGEQENGRIKTLRKMKPRIRKTLYKKTIEDRVENNLI